MADMPRIQRYFLRQARFSTVGCIRLVGWSEFKPAESLFWSLKGLDIHPSIYSNGFPKSFRVTKRLMHNICKPRSNSVFIDKSQSFFGRECAVAEALQLLGFCLHVPAIEQYCLGLILGNSPKHLQEGLFGIFQRELSACIDAEKPRLKMHV